MSAQDILRAADLARPIKSETFQGGKNSPERLEYIDVFRAVACIWIIFHHNLSDDAHKISGLGERLAVHLSTLGWLGVSIFLILSGFCLYYPVASRGVDPLPDGWKVFWKKRALRILPVYYAALALYLICSSIHLASGPHWQFSDNIVDVILHFALVYNIFPQYIGGISDHFWYIGLQCQLYLIYPLLIFSISRIGIKKMLGACLLLSLAWQVYVYHLIGFSHSWQPLFASYYHSLFGRFFEFALGIAAAHLAVHPLKKQNLIAFLAILILFAPALYYSTHISRFGPLMDQTWGVIFTSFILLCHSVRSHRIWKTTVFRILAWLGGFSYSLYLMQILAKNFAGSIVSFLRTENFGFLTRHDLFAHMIFSLPLAIAFGWLFYLIFEKKDSALNRAIQSWSFFRFPESKKSA